MFLTNIGFGISEGICSLRDKVCEEKFYKACARYEGISTYEFKKREKEKIPEEVRERIKKEDREARKENARHKRENMFGVHYVNAFTDKKNLRTMEELMADIYAKEQMENAKTAIETNKSSSTVKTEITISEKCFKDIKISQIPEYFDTTISKYVDDMFRDYVVSTLEDIINDKDYQYNDDVVIGDIGVDLVIKSIYTDKKFFPNFPADDRKIFDLIKSKLVDDIIDMNDFKYYLHAANGNAVVKMMNGKAERLLKDISNIYKYHTTSDQIKDVVKTIALQLIDGGEEKTTKKYIIDNIGNICKDMSENEDTDISAIGMILEFIKDGNIISYEIFTELVRSVILLNSMMDLKDIDPSKFNVKMEFPYTKNAAQSMPSEEKAEETKEEEKTEEPEEDEKVEETKEEQPEDEKVEESKEEENTEEPKEEDKTEESKEEQPEDEKVEESKEEQSKPEEVKEDVKKDSRQNKNVPVSDSGENKKPEQKIESKPVSQKPATGKGRGKNRNTSHPKTKEIMIEQLKKKPANNKVEVVADGFEPEVDDVKDVLNMVTDGNVIQLP